MVLRKPTSERLETLRCADAIFLEELRAGGDVRFRRRSPCCCPCGSVGVMGDGRTYADTIAAARRYHRRFYDRGRACLPFELIARVSNRIVNEVSGESCAGPRRELQAASDD